MKGEPLSSKRQMRCSWISGRCEFNTTLKDPPHHVGWAPQDVQPHLGPISRALSETLSNLQSWVGDQEMVNQERFRLTSRQRSSLKKDATDRSGVFLWVKQRLPHDLDPTTFLSFRNNIKKQGNVQTLDHWQGFALTLWPWIEFRSQRFDFQYLWLYL